MSTAVNERPEPVLLEVKRDPWRRDITLMIAGVIVTSIVILLASLNGVMRLSDMEDRIAAIEIPDPVIVETPPTTTYVARIEVNALVRSMIIDGRSEEIYRFYDQQTGNREITHALVNTALLSEIPVNLLFALVAWESGYNPRALNENPGSSDHGLMQLNSKTFAALSLDEMHDPIVNIRHGAAYLAARYQDYGSWEAAVIAYNGGNTELVRGGTIHHLVNVLTNERSLDRSFVEAFGG